MWNDPTAFEIEEPHRFTHALDRPLTEILKAEVPLDEPRRVLRETDVPRLGMRLHALRETDDMSLAVNSMCRSSPIRPTTTSPELSPMRTANGIPC